MRLTRAMAAVRCTRNASTYEPPWKVAAKTKARARAPTNGMTARNRAEGDNKSNTAKESKLSLTDRKAWAAQRFRSTEQAGDTSGAGSNLGASARADEPRLSGQGSAEPEIDPKAEPVKLSYGADGKPVRPREPHPAECCGSGCRSCVWIQYWEASNLYEQVVAKGNNNGSGRGVSDDQSSAAVKPAKDSHFLINHFR